MNDILEILENDWYYLFNDDHEQHLRPEVIAVQRRKNMVLYDYDVQMIPGRMWPKFPEIVLQLRRNLIQEIDPTRERTRARCVRQKLSPYTTTVVTAKNDSVSLVYAVSTEDILETNENTDRTIGLLLLPLPSLPPMLPLLPIYCCCYSQHYYSGTCGDPKNYPSSQLIIFPPSYIYIIYMSKNL